VKQHIVTKKPSYYEKVQTSTHKMPEFFGGEEDLSAIRAETLFTKFIIEFHLKNYDVCSMKRSVPFAAA